MPPFVTALIDLFLHLDKHLSAVIQTYGAWTYGLLFCVFFVETGVVVMPFLPGDSLLFAAGTFAATGSFSLPKLMGLLFLAVVLGDNTNYWIGRQIGPRVFTDKVRFLNKKYLDRTHAFYERHGGKTVFLARFIPIVRTFAPFVAGIGAMNYGRFLLYDLFGGLTWTAGFTLAGYFFGNLPVVKENFSLAIMAIILISVTPMFVEFLRHRKMGAESGTPTPP